MGAADGMTRADRWERAATRVPSWFGAFFGLLGAACAVAALVSPLRWLLEPLLQLVNDWLVPASPNLAYAVFLLLLSGALVARKRVAWWVLTCYTLLLLAVEVLALVLFDAVDVVPPLAVTALVLAVLVLTRGQFYARVRRGAFWRALGVLLVGLGAAVLLGWGLVEVFHGGLPPDERLRWAANRVLGGLVAAKGITRRPPAAVNFVCGLLGAIALVNAAAVLFRSQRAQARLHPDEEVRIRTLLARYGRHDSLGYFATRRDKAVVFSPDGEAAVTYRVETGVCLASSDPIGARGSWGRAIEAWLELSRQYAWVPAVMGASEEGARAYGRAGLNALQLGDEAILKTADFDLNGPDARVTRQAVNRVRRTGATTRIRRHSALDAEEIARVAVLADAWRDTEVERGFSMALGRLGDPVDGDCLLVEAVAADGRTIALLSFVPWGADGVSLDVMRRDRSAPNGVMEFMIAELAAQGPALGIRRISLNFAVFRAAFEEGARIGAGPVLRLWRRLLLFFSKWWQLEALYRANVKYRPLWYPRFLCFPEGRLLARIALASGIAEGFVPAPRFAGWRGAGVLPPVSAVPLPPLPEGRPAEELPGAAEAGAYDMAALPDQVRVRHRKLERLYEQGSEPYPVLVARSHTLAEVRTDHPAPAPGTRTGRRVAVAGRVVLQRDFGGVVFLVLRDWSADLQIVLTRAGLGAAGLQRFTADVDLGDLIAVAGEVGSSDKGELSVFADTWQMAAKCLRPLPDKRQGLSDPEARVRRRYVDLAIRPQARDVLRARSAAVQALRQGLLDRGFLEVETPMLQRVHGGANARPFRTRINAYGLDLYLRIAPELYLKRLCVGGVEKVFELGRTFRNEGTSYKHNPEFTMLEAYQAYADYTGMMDLARELIQSAATAAHGAPMVRRAADGDNPAAEYDISGRWPVRTVFGAVSEALGEEIGPGTGIERLREMCDRARVPYGPAMGPGQVVLEMYERLVEERTTLPTFYKDFPTDVSPLTRRSRTDARLAERWDLVAFGTELGTAYSELIDPVEQRKRLVLQSLLAAGGDLEAMEVDEDFLTALEYAMPPTGGLGLGVDRLVMFLTGLSIRETLPFPLVRPR